MPKWTPAYRRRYMRRYARERAKRIAEASTPLQLTPETVEVESIDVNAVVAAVSTLRDLQQQERQLAIALSQSM